MGDQQADRPLTVDTPLGKDVLLLRGLNGYESVSQIFRFELDLMASNTADVAFDKLLGQKVTAHVSLPKGGKRHFNGLCVRVSQGQRDPREKMFTAYRIEIVADLWKLTRKAQSRIFQHLSVPDILKRVLAGLDVAYELQGAFQPRDYCVQYRETDFNFATRLMEEEGIYYFFKHSEKNHTMVVANTPGSHTDLPAPSSLIYETVFEGTRDEDRIHDWMKSQDLRSGKVTLWDHSFELPHQHLEADKTIQESVSVGKVSHKLKVGDNTKLEIYDFPGEYAQRFDGIDKGGGEQPSELQKIFQDNKRTVEIRMQEEALPSLTIHGSSNCRHMVAGFKFTLQRHFNADGGPYVLTEVRHSASGSGDYRAGATGAFRYSNQFTCIPLALPFRPPRMTPRPVVSGTQTAVVVGPSGEEIFTDKYGRVKVQFHWDREGQHDPDSSCWLRVATYWAGKMWGAVHIPRIGQEVLVDFLDGDPDQPIIVGSVYNADMMPPYKLPAMKTAVGVKSRSSLGGAPQNFNEIRFEDKKGKEQIFVHAEKNMDVLVKNDSMESVYHDKHLTVGGEKDGGRWGELRELVYADRNTRVKGWHLEAIEGSVGLQIGWGDSGSGGNAMIKIQKNRDEEIGGDVGLSVKGSRTVLVDSDDSLTVNGSRQEKVKTKYALESQEEVHIKAGMKLVIEAGIQLTIKGPGGFIEIGPAGVTIQGILVKINSGGSAGSGSGSTPAYPAELEVAEPKKPIPADNPKTGY